jgi:hypothetical protein
MSLTLARRVADQQIEQFAARCDGGYLDLYAGDRPLSPDAVPLGVRLASLRLGNPAFTLAIGGIATAKPIQDDPSAEASGIPQWFRIYEPDHLTPVCDGSIGESDADVILRPLAIRRQAKVSLRRLTVTLKE